MDIDTRPRERRTELQELKPGVTFVLGGSARKIFVKGFFVDTDVNKCFPSNTSQPCTDLFTGGVELIPDHTFVTPVTIYGARMSDDEVEA